jgi:HNH endonuclease
MVGVIVPLRPTPNAKFDTFSERFDFNGHSTREAWKISFEDGRAVDAFLNVCESYADHGIEAAVRTASSFQQRAPSVTSRPAQIARRVGQATYRKQLLDYWRGCAVTGCSESLLLRSSHIKPWRDSTPEERLDPFNGLLLVPNLDLLFDCGFISFSDDKAILISSELSSVDLCALGVSASMRLTKLNGAHLRYLQYHREVRFRP